MKSDEGITNGLGQRESSAWPKLIKYYGGEGAHFSFTLSNYFRKFLFSLAGALLSSTLLAAPDPGQPSTAFIPLVKGAELRLAGPLPSTEVFFQLPGHIALAGPARLTLRFRASQLLLASVSTATVEINGTPIRSIRLPSEAGEDGRTLEITVPSGLLRIGWNTARVHCLLLTTDVLCRDVDNPACWFVLDKGTGITVPYRRLELFPEPGRFPDTIAEEQLLRQEELVDGFPPDSIRPVASILVPAQPGNAAFRAFVIAAARLGQPSYLPRQSVRPGKLADWKDRADATNGILIGLASDLSPLDLPAETRAAIAALKPGEGLVSEFILGEFPSVQRRWIAVCGADEPGLINAALAIGSNDVLGAAAAGPLVIRDTPRILPLTEEIAKPARGPQTFAQLNGAPVVLRGIFRSQASVPWKLPLGYETAAGSELILEMSHAAGFADASAAQFDVNGRHLPGISLRNMPEQALMVRIGIPPGIPGRAPNSLLLTSYLDIGTIDCGHRNPERAWIAFSPSSSLVVFAQPLAISGLDRLGLVLLRDAFLRRACILLPKSALPSGLDLARDIAMYAGKNAATMPVLWPQAALYAPGEPAPDAAVKDTSIVLLGSPADWRAALPENTLLSIDAVPGKESLRLQGTAVPFAQLPGDTVFAQFLTSPWSPDNCVVAVGGTGGPGGRVAARLLTDGEILSKVGGTVAGLDAQGRIFHYDVRTPSSLSLSEQVQRALPKGLSAQETEKKLSLDEQLRSYLTIRNAVIGGIVLLVVLLMIRTQIRLNRIKADLRRKEIEESTKDG